MRADGRVDLDIRAVVETENGGRIALSAAGVAMPRAAEPIADLLENVSLSTAAEEYVWVNTRQVWGVGTVNFAVGKIHIDAYMQ
jgi:predicted extracellular nuclease